jgi:hypothetical protein
MGILKYLGYKIIPGYEKYMCNEKGDVYSTKTNKMMTQCLSGNGYFTVYIEKKNLTIHSLVAKTHIYCPLNKVEVNHKDGNKKNNHISNLEWCDSSENKKHARETGLSRYRSKKVQMLDDNKNVLKEFSSIKDALIHANIKSNCSISKAIKGNHRSGGYYWAYSENVETVDATGWLSPHNYTKYLVGKCGRIYSKKFKQLLKPTKNHKVDVISDDGKHQQLFISKFVMNTYFPNTHKKNIFVKHKNGDRSDNRVINLEWSTRSDICNQSVALGKGKKIRSVCKYDLNGKLLKIYKSISDATKDVKCCQSIIGASCRERRKTAAGFIWLYKEDDISKRLLRM